MPNQSAGDFVNEKGAGPVAQSFSNFEHNRASGARLLENVHLYAEPFPLVARRSETSYVPQGRRSFITKISIVTGPEAAVQATRTPVVLKLPKIEVTEG